MRFGISTHLYHDRPLASEHLKEMAEFGFSEVERPGTDVTVTRRTV
jgi:hypothetical protein